MGERKVLNRYIPPDMDVTIMPKGFMKRPKDKLVEVRMMLPFSLRCNTCGEYMYKGKKFNSRSEIITDDNYMGIRKFRFYIKCCVCSAEITFKTDPKNADYECEFGASRNFEMWRDNKEALDGAAAEKEEEENLDSMKALENKTLDNKVEMDVLDALDEMRAINRRHQKVDTAAMLSNMNKDKEVLNANGLTAADEEYVKSIKFNPKPKNTEGLSSSSQIVSSVSVPAVPVVPAVKPQTKPATTVILKKKRKLPVPGQDASSSSASRKITKQTSSSISSVKGSVGAGRGSGNANAATSIDEKPSAAPVAALGGLGGLMGYGSGDSD